MFAIYDVEVESEITGMLKSNGRVKEEDSPSNNSSTTRKRSSVRFNSNSYEESGT